MRTEEKRTGVDRTNGRTTRRLSKLGGPDCVSSIWEDENSEERQTCLSPVEEKEQEAVPEKKGGVQHPLGREELSPGEEVGKEIVFSWNMGSREVDLTKQTPLPEIQSESTERRGMSTTLMIDVRYHRRVVRPK